MGMILDDAENDESLQEIEVRFIGKIDDPNGTFSLLIQHKSYLFRPTCMILVDHLDEVRHKARVITESDYQRAMAKKTAPKPELSKADKAKAAEDEKLRLAAVA